MNAMNDVDFDLLSQEFGQLSDPTRLRILALLSAGSKNVTALCKALDQKQPTVSHHLGLLRRVGLVNSVREGKSVVYEINPDRVAALQDMLARLTPGVAAEVARPLVPEPDVSSDLEALRDKVEAEIESARETGRKAFDDEDYEKAQEASERAAALVDFRDRLESLCEEWADLAAAAGPEDDEQGRQERRYMGRLDPGVRTPQSEYYRPILQVLNELDGSGQVAEVLDRVGEAMKPVFKEVDYEPLPSHGGAPRWRNAAQWARNSMVEEGLLKADSPRGVWEISDKGRDMLRVGDRE